MVKQRKQLHGLRIPSIVTIAGLCALTACGREPSAEQGPGAVLQELSPAPARDPIAARVEDALRDVETGRDVAGARATLEAVVQAPEAAANVKDDARLGLSRALELQGDKEGAVRAVEDLIASHTTEARFPARGLAERRLRKLLTGDETEPSRLPVELNVPPMAKVLASKLHPRADGSYDIQILVFGRPWTSGEELGTFSIGGALRDLKKNQCPLCDNQLEISTSRSQVGSWVAIPAAAAQQPSEGPSMATALTVFYYDLEANRIPSRYDAYLPVGSDKIAATLREGHGLVAVKPREGAAPVVLIAAPRPALLADVEKAFSEMTELPLEPTPIPLSTKLRPEEIQYVFRSTYPQFRACYEELMRSDPDARGKIVVWLEIAADGSLPVARMHEETTLRDATLQQCFLEAVKQMRFPAGGRTTTVKYPILLTPGS